VNHDWSAALLHIRLQDKLGRRKLREATGGELKESQIERIERAGPKDDAEAQRLSSLLTLVVPRLPWLGPFLADGTLPSDGQTGEQLQLPPVPMPPPGSDLVDNGPVGDAVADEAFPTPYREPGPDEPTEGQVEANRTKPPVVIVLEDEDPDDMLVMVEAPSGDAPFLMSNGQRASKQRCLRQWWLAWYLGLAPRVEDLTGARATGTRVHRALAALYVPPEETPQDPRDALERVIVEDWTRMLRSLGREPGEEGEYEDPRVESLARKFNDATTMERAVVSGYVEWLSETGADQEYDVLGSEVTMVADVKDEISDRVVRVISLQDARVRRRTDNVRLFIDHKTVGDLVAKTITLPMNEQMLHYHLVEWLNTPEGETRCDGALWNMLKKNKRTDRAKPPFYERLEVPHNMHEIESYRRRLLTHARQIQEMTAALDAGAHHLDVVPPTPTDTCRWDCDFFNVCRLFDDGSRVDDALDSLFVKVDPLDRYDRLVLAGGR
jgi:hypothetical protein